MDVCRSLRFTSLLAVLLIAGAASAADEMTADDMAADDIVTLENPHTEILRLATPHRVHMVAHVLLVVVLEHEVGSL